MMGMATEISAVSTRDSLGTRGEDFFPGEWRAEDAIRVCRKNVEGWRGIPKETFILETISGGMTNHLYRCSTTHPGVPQSSVLLRIFGQGTSVCRTKDNLIFKAMSEAGLGPELHATFEQGRIEEFLDDSRPLTNEEMQMPTYAKQIAKSLAMVHELQIPIPRSEPQLLQDLKQVIASLDVNARALLPHTPEYYMEKMEKILAGTDSPIVFCHNDLQEGNIMVNEKRGDITLIDFEYGGYNYAMFDVGNHFAEYAFVYNDLPAGDLGFELRKDAYPSRKEMVEFLGEYNSVLQNGTEPEDMIETVQRFILASHLYWGLWSAGMGSRGAGYVSYMNTRLSEFERISEGLL
uniref:Choline kinase N-terminal domain-containing protein n=1 Tax=Rhodosorus marinus TaxID=101924 RepID=A0A7S0G0N8_9RHOD|mmetsp:Transcript_13865/g.20047  ORF Transcript_13865/g.20047 Transcript_13865/m.20047 type:complete len:349 (+) Transcript_13865:158-1204(+)